MGKVAVSWIKILAANPNLNPNPTILSNETATLPDHGQYQVRRHDSDRRYQPEPLRVALDLERAPARTLLVQCWERIPERSCHNILPMEWLAGKITSSLHESNFACYNCINGITSTADEYSSTSYNCISNITICRRTVEEDYPSAVPCMAMIRI